MTKILNSMSQATKNNVQSTLPVVFVKVKGNQLANFKKDEYIWYSYFEKILNITIAFIQVEKADAPNEKKLFEDSTKIYLTNQGLQVLSTEYHDNASTLEKYLKITNK